jgi:hypothetical protein
MTNTDDKDRERARENERRIAQEKARQRSTRIQRTKDIIWSAVIASIISIVFLTSMGWLTTQSVVKAARNDGLKEVVALRSSICLANFQQRTDAVSKLAEFKALSYSDKDTAIRKFVTDQKLATMSGEESPAAGAVEKCADAVKRLA